MQSLARLLVLSALSLLASVNWENAVDVAAKEVHFHGVIMVRTPGRVILNKAFTDATSQPTPNTRYWVASISKSLTATIIFRLREQGKLSLNDSVVKFFPNAPPDKKAITIEQLLTHTSGLPNMYVSEGIVDRTEAANRLLALPLAHNPGEEFGYTNDGYSLLAAIAEVSSGTSYRELLERYIFRPAAMTNSGLWPVCSGSMPTLPLSDKLPPEKMRENWGFKGPDGVCSTTDDLGNFMTALVGGKILRSESLTAMWKERVPIKTGFATAGWFLSKSPRGLRVIWTRGTDHGHNSIIKYYPQRDVIVVSLSSSRDPEGPLLARVLVDKLEMDLN